jgi:hypothetical protein
MQQQKKAWIASSRSLSSGAHSRDPLVPLRKRFAFVAGNDVGTQLRDLAAGYARVLPKISRPPIRGRRECRTLGASAAARVV